MGRERPRDSSTHPTVVRFTSRSVLRFSWPTDACGYDQSVRFVKHRNLHWHGGTCEEFVDAGDNAHRLARELGDVQAAIAIVQRLGIVDWRDVNAAMQDKLARVTTYLHSAEVKAAVVAERGGR